MKNALYTILALLLLVSCSDSNNNLEIDDSEIDNSDDDVEVFELSFATKSGGGNIFEPMVFNLYSEETFSMFDLSRVYDSVNWEVAGLEGRCDIFSKNSGDDFLELHMVREWTHNFFLPGKYEAYLFCYKNDKVIHSDTVSVDIGSNKDFLDYNWTDVKGNAWSRGYKNALCKDFDFYTTERFVNDVPSITLSLENDDDDESFAEKSKMLLHDYINSLYSIKPAYDLGSSELLNKYDELFINREENNSPHCIWLTPKANIVLVEYLEFSKYTLYKIYAEPN